MMSYEQKTDEFKSKNRSRCSKETFEDQIQTNFKKRQTTLKILIEKKISIKRLIILKMILYNRITEDVLNDKILPEAFAVVKETAKRFVHNEKLQ